MPDEGALLDAATSGGNVPTEDGSGAGGYDALEEASGIRVIE